MSIEKTPSELVKDEKLEHCLENILQKTTIGFLVSVIPAVAFLGRRVPVASRLSRFGLGTGTGVGTGIGCTAIGFGTGIGFGIGWTECRLLMEKNIHFRKKFVAHVEVPTTTQK
ncbi:hypothetical protein ABK040_010438 [Willaertia magna]